MESEHKPWFEESLTIFGKFHLRRLPTHQLKNVAWILFNPFPRAHFRKCYSNRNWLKFLFSHFFAVPPKVLWRPSQRPSQTFWGTTKNCEHKNFFSSSGSREEKLTTTKNRNSKLYWHIEKSILFLYINPLNASVVLI